MSVSSFVYALLAGILPSIIWLIFWTHEDDDRDAPRWLLILSFFGGALTVILAVFIEKWIADIVSDPSFRYALWATTEEILKFIIIVAIVFNHNYNDEPIKAMIYGIVVAIGFAALENTLFILEPFSNGEIAKGIITSNMRFIGATLVHIVSSAMIGFAFGYVYYAKIIKKITAGIIGLSSAIVLHTAFNLFILNVSTKDTMKVFGFVWLAVVILLILFEEVKAVRPPYHNLKLKS
jgi:protease PrsW